MKTFESETSPVNVTQTDFEERANMNVDLKERNDSASILQIICAKLTFMKVPLQFFHNGERFFKNKRLLLASLTVLALIGSSTIVAVSDFGKIKSVNTY